MTTATAEAPADPGTLTYRKHACGFCTAGLHHLCQVATWNPGSGEILIPASGGQPAQYAGEALYCACPADECQGKRPVCRLCGYDPGYVEALAPGLVCADGVACTLRVSARLEDDPLHQLLLECQTTRLVAGEVTQRPRRATPIERVQRQAAKVAARSRECTCGCGGTTKGGAFLPGHDARFVSMLVGLDDLSSGRLALAPFPKLLAKFEKRVG